MLTDDLDSRKDAPKPRLLDPLSIDDELRSYIADLQAEIVRVQSAIATKVAHREAVAALFGKPPSEVG